MSDLDTCQHLGLPLLMWKREGTDPKKWKGPHLKGWNSPDATHDVRGFDPSVHNVGALTGREIASGKFLTDIDIDKLIQYFAEQFFPETHCALMRPGKELSHLFYTVPTPLKGKLAFLSVKDDSPFAELRSQSAEGKLLQTMVPPSLHTPPDQRVAFREAGPISHIQTLEVLKVAHLNYSIASLVQEAFPTGFHHDERMALAGFLLKRGFDEQRVQKLLQTVCRYQVQCRMPDMSGYDDDDSAENVKSTVAKLKAKERVSGYQHLHEVNADFIQRLQRWLGGSGHISREDFYAYMPTHSYLFIPSREFWPAGSVNARVPSIEVGIDDKGKPKTVPANVWLDWHRPVEQMTWAPGFPMLIQDRLVSDGGWIEREGCSCINLYRPPQIESGNPHAAEWWLRLVGDVYPDDANHIVAWLAHRVQRPQEKINHALVLGGAPGIGKDSILEPVKTAIGPWNFVEISPSHLLGRFNGFVKSVILRVSEARDLGEMNRYDFYEHMKVYAAAPPDVLRVDEKNIREHAVFNVCGVIITTNHETDGIYLPADDRRHYVAWSSRQQEYFGKSFWDELYAWYDNGGRRHVAAYLAAYDLSNFNPKAPPHKTRAFWTIVDANRPSEDAELADVLDYLSEPHPTVMGELVRPKAITLSKLVDKSFEKGLYELVEWLKDRRSTRQIPHRLKTAGYVPYRNPSAKDGQWKIGDKRQVVYVQETLSVPDCGKAVAKLGAK